MQETFAFPQLTVFPPTFRLVIEDSRKYDYRGLVKRRELGQHAIEDFLHLNRGTFPRGEEPRPLCLLNRCKEKGA